MTHNMAGVRIKKYNNCDILFIDFEGCLYDEQMISIICRTKKYILDSPRPYRQLINFKNAFITPAFMNEMQCVARSIPASDTKRAMVGDSSVSKQILFRKLDLLLGGRSLALFPDLFAALDYLTVRE
jgi:hypothetical protein